MTENNNDDVRKKFREITEKHFGKERTDIIMARITNLEIKQISRLANAKQSVEVTKLLNEIADRPILQ